MNVCVSAFSLNLRVRKKEAETGSFPDNPDKYLFISFVEVNRILEILSTLVLILKGLVHVWFVRLHKSAMIQWNFLEDFKKQIRWCLQLKLKGLFVYIILLEWEIGNSKMFPHFSPLLLWQPFVMITFSLFICYYPAYALMILMGAVGCAEE